MKKTILTLCMGMALLTGCKQQTDNRPKELLKKAQTACNERRYDEALNTIEQLRHDFPDAISERREALTLFQEVSLRQAQEDLARTDSLLQDANRCHNALQQKMKQCPYSKQVGHELTKARLTRDSLQIRWNALGAKIQLIHKRQEELKNKAERP